MGKRLINACLWLVLAASPLGAAATEAEHIRPVAPATIDAESLAFEMQFARGARFEIGAPDSEGYRNVSVRGCGRRARAVLSERMRGDGNILIAYEFSDSEQRRDTCTVNVVLRLTCDPFSSLNLRTWMLNVMVVDGRLRIGNDNPAARCPRPFRIGNRYNTGR